MAQVLFSLAILACPLGMGAMMWAMMRGGKQHPAAPGDEVSRLRAEVEQLKGAAAVPVLAREGGGER